MSSSIRLYLTRHGRTEWNHVRRFQGCTDIPLDEVGRAQARALADVLRGRIEAVIASDLSRARETAGIIAETLQLPVLAVDPDLRERGYGVFEGLTRDECIARHPEAWAARGGNPNFVAPGGEPHASVLERMRRGLERSIALLRGQHENALVVCHGSSLRMFLETLSGQPEVPLGNMEFREVVHDGERFVLGN